MAARNESPPADAMDHELEPLAIVGMSCRLPGDVKTPEELWELCARKRSGWSEIPESRFNAAAYYHPDAGRSGTFNPKGGHFLQQDLALFDAPFFNISLQEAKSMDPQQRIMLECTYEAMENGGFSKTMMQGKDVGVFVGSSFSDYELNNLRDTENVPMYQTTGCANSLLSNRLSYFFDFKGPSFTVDTACSSSLVALHLACQSLRRGESSSAIVGGCHLNITPDFFISMSMSRLFSDTGKSYSFDERGNSGFGRGEGAGCIVLKPLSAAIADNDSIRAVIMHTGLNQDGRTQGISVPNSQAQEELIRSVYRAAKLDTNDTGYIEAHGTGTKVGDPLEARALHAVFGEGRTKNKPLFVGSIKSNVGHLEGASGIISVIKTAMMLDRGFVLPDCDFQTAKASIPLDEWGMKVPIRQVPWPRGKKYASVNNFGYGGTNAHIVMGRGPQLRKQVMMQQVSVHAPAENRDQEPKGPVRKIYALSGNDEKATNDAVRNMIIFLERNPAVFDLALMDNIAYTLGQRRSHLSWRHAVSAQTSKELIGTMTVPDTKPQKGFETPVIGFVFTGQGAQWSGMAKELLAAYPVFADTLTEADKHIASLGAQFSLLDEIYQTERPSIIGQGHVSQPACTAIQIALTALLRSWGIRPTAVVGHSSGEVAAAYAAEMINLEEAMTIAYYRGISVQHLAQTRPDLKGAMMAVGAGEEEIRPIIDGLKAQKADIACINSPNSSTISGDEEAIIELQGILEKNNTFARRLQVTVAYHSHHMCLASDFYRSQVKGIVPRESDITFHSSVTGNKMEPKQLVGEYWVQNLESRVEFVKGLGNLLAEGRSANGKPINNLIELGPHAALEGPIKQILKSLDASSKVQYFGTLRRNKDAIETTQGTAAAIFSKGADVDLMAVNFPVDQPRKLNVLTSLPKYPWNHETRYWHDSRIGNNFMQRQFARSDFLGSLSLESDDLEPRWRNVLRADENPWVRDHKAQGNNIFPMAGYISMAIEALAQQSKRKNATPTGYTLREITVGKALIVSDTAAVETMITLRPQTEGTRVSSDTWNEFRVFSWTASKGWDEHCRGLITINTPAKVNPLEDQSKRLIRTAAASEGLRAFDKSCASEYDVISMYSTIDAKGMQYGPLFRGISACRMGNKRTVFDFPVPNTAASMPFQYETECLVHPATLDTCIQAVWPLIGENKDASTGLYLPAFLKSVTVNTMDRIQHGQTLRVYGEQGHVETAHGPIDHNMWVADINDPTKVLVHFEGLSMVPINDGNMIMDKEAAKLCYKMELEPCLDLIDIKSFVNASISPESVEAGKRGAKMLEQASYLYIAKACKEMATADVTAFKPHHQKFWSWMQKQNQAKSHLQLQERLHDTFISDVRASSPAGELLCDIGAAIPQILRQEIDPVSIMNEDGRLERFYQTFDPYCQSYEVAKQCISMMAAQNPSMTVLEIGAGTGAATQSILEAFGGELNDNTSKFKQYTYTDISGASFEPAEAKFAAWADHMDFRTLDISTDPASQGFKANSYDLVVACGVLHTTAKMNVTLNNARQLLKPGGKLLLIEETSQTLRQFIYGILPEWWTAEDTFRQEGGPTISSATWDTLLRDTGFSGVDASFDDYPGSTEQQCSLLLSTATVPAETKDEEVVVVCPTEIGQFSTKALIDSITKHTGRTPTISDLLTADAKDKICVVVYELFGSLLSNMTPELFTAMQQILLNARGVLWVTRADKTATPSPDLSLITGLARSVRSENNTQFVTMDLESRQATPDNVAIEDIARVLGYSFFTSSVLNTGEMEFTKRNGIMSTPRIVEDAPLNEHIHREQDGAIPYLQPFRQEGRAMTMALENFGMLDTIHFKDDETATLPLPDNYIEITVQYTGLNFKDVMHAMGQLNSDRFGIECSGIVSKCGSKVTDFAVGDRVCAMVEGCLANYARCPSTSAWKVPKSMEMMSAATIPIIFCTVYYSLVETARLQADESVLIHAAAGGVGQAAIILAQALGAEIYATVGSVGKKDFLIETYGIKSENIFFSRDLTFAEGIKKATNGRGVDVVLNSLAGEALRMTWECLAPFGRFIEIGKKDIKRNTKLEMAQFDNNVSFSSVDLTVVMHHRPALMKKLFRDVFAMFESGQLRDIAPITRYSVSDLEEAMHNLQSGRSMGKIVIETNGDAMVKASRKATADNLFRSDSTYVIIGGTGGLGREMTDVLADKGAKHIVLVSRSGGDREKVDALVEKMKQDGVQIVVCKCDMADKIAVDTNLKAALKELPPVAGAVYGAMVLEDVLFEKMEYAQYDSVLRPKLDGVWNLHDCLSDQKLDFFFTLSSVAGIVGNQGQAAYAATATFMDSFVAYRKSLGLPCSTLDLAPVMGVGVLAEDVQKLEQVSSIFKEVAVDKDEFKALFTAAVSGAFGLSCDDHCITGIMPAGNLREAFWGNDPKFSILAQKQANKAGDGSAGAANTQSLSEAIASQLDIGGVEKVVLEALIKKVSTMLMRPEADFHPTTSLVNYGLDSLVAIEFRNWITRELGANLQILEILASESVAALGSLIVTRTSIPLPKVKEEASA